MWITGLPGSGKSVIARALIKQLNEKNINVQLLSSDELRRIITPTPTYSTQERDIVYGVIVYVAKLLTQNGINVLIDATGNLRVYRDNARSQISRFFEVYLECPIEVCMKREAERKETFNAPKGIYDKALKGKSATVPGLGQPYETPLNPELIIKSFESTPDQAAQKIVNLLRSF